MEERLQKIISASGLMSRRAAEELLRAGKVTVNGAVANLGDKADAENDDIRVEGRSIPKNDKLIYIMLNKPRGYVTTLHDEKDRHCVSELTAELETRLYPCGRLDLNSEGLLVMTNDGDFANKLMHPSHDVTKVYRTYVRGLGIERAAEALKKPIRIDKVTVQAKNVQLLECKGDAGVLLISISEGRNRQVRKMCDAVGLKVARLIRIAEGELRLGDLKSGMWRKLTKNEIDYVTRRADKKNG